MRRATLWITLGTVVLQPACAPKEQFACNADEQCQIGEIAGRCEPERVCSFPDSDCPSGHRYGELSGDVAGECVEGGSGTGPATDEGTTAVVPPLTEGADGSGAGTSSSTSGTSSTSTSTTSDASSSSTTASEPDPYGPCSDDSDCPLPGSTCLTFPVGSICSPPCETGTCPAAQQGALTPSCLPLEAGNPACVLVCSSQRDCPPGTMCQSFMGGIGLCMWP